MQTDESITIREDHILFESAKIKTQIVSGEIVDKSQKFFLLELSQEEDQPSKVIHDLLKRIRMLVTKFGGEMNILWDDLGIENATNAYPIICQLENLLRKLITKFMLTNIGTSWVSNTLPNEVKEAVGKNKRPNMSLLHNVDFSHLADFLFKPYATNSSSELYDRIRKSNEISDFDIADLKTYVPKSNWQRYFNKVVECEDEFLSKRWGKLYELRCLVAHNNFVTDREFDEIVDLANQIRTPILEALAKLNQIIVPDDEKTQIIENAAVNLSERVKEYLDLWHEVSGLIDQAYSKSGGDEQISLREKVKYLLSEELIKDEFLSAITPLGEFRNALVHGHLTGEVDSKTISEKIEDLNHFYTKFILFESPFF